MCRFWNFPAKSVGDDVKISLDDSGESNTMVHFKTTKKKSDGLPYYCLADFICPEEKKEDF
ncbi:MAG: hypothetical protein IPL63_10725 [Saprospiraceae bacterium]|nr:hypothetical protein [Saprospiraceae bacterium]